MFNVRLPFQAKVHLEELAVAGEDSEYQIVSFQLV